MLSTSPSMEQNKSNVNRNVSKYNIYQVPKKPSLIDQEQSWGLWDMFPFNTAANKSETKGSQNSNGPQSTSAALPNEQPIGLALRQHFLTELYYGRDPFSIVRPGSKYSYSANWGYPHTHLKSDIIDCVLNWVKPSFWMEIGTMTGGSAIRTADRIKANPALSTFVLCADPFTGDVNMWAWQKNLLMKKQWDFELMDSYGIPRIFETMLANVYAKGHDDIILPLKASSLVAMRLLPRLEADDRLPWRPQVIYLDSAHERDETFMEVRAAYKLLAKGGILFGDDWNWDAIGADVMKFAKQSMVGKKIPDQMVRSFLAENAEFAQQPVDGVIVLDNQWFIMKFEETLR